MAGTSFRSIAVLTLVPVIGLIAFLAWMIVRPHAPAPPTKASGLGSRASVPPPTRAEAIPRPEARGPRPQIVIIIDDVGYEGQPIDRAMAIDRNFNFAVLPNSTRASQIAERLHGQGFEILCHLPMEPRDRRFSPGSNAVLTSMSDREIVDITKQNIAAVPYASGVNNHMGSLATADRRVMTDVMRALPQGMYFIDSRTDGSSVAAKIAHEMNVKTATRQVFLDDVQTDDAVRHQMELLSSAARTKGIAIGIGHPHPVTLRVLAEQVPQLKAQGFTFVRASQAVN
jgi:uncharacterized protein